MRKLLVSRIKVNLKKVDLMNRLVSTKHQIFGVDCSHQELSEDEVGQLVLYRNVAHDTRDVVVAHENEFWRVEQREVCWRFVAVFASKKVERAVGERPVFELNHAFKSIVHLTEFHNFIQNNLNQRTFFLKIHLIVFVER